MESEIFRLSQEIILLGADILGITSKFDFASTVHLLC